MCSIKPELSARRPDANILTGQIHSNLDCRICGQSDNVLSRIIPDSTDAAACVPGYAQGWFPARDGDVPV